MAMHDACRLQPAEYEKALLLCSNLAFAHDELIVQHRVLEIYSGLFAPQRTVLWILENGKVEQTLFYPEIGSVPGWVSETPPVLDNRPDPAGTFPYVTPAGFRLRIQYNADPVGIIELDRLMFPEKIPRYLPLALAVADICGIALVGAKIQRRSRSFRPEERTDDEGRSEKRENMGHVYPESESGVFNTIQEFEDAMDLFREWIRKRTDENGCL